MIKRRATKLSWRRCGLVEIVFTLSLIAFAGLALTFHSCQQQYTLSGPYVREYEGQVLDKSQTITESRTGSGVRRRLLIEGKGGERFQVAVGENTYERAQKGMRIKKTEAGDIELTWPDRAIAPR